MGKKGETWVNQLPQGYGSVGQRFEVLCIEFDKSQLLAATEQVHHTLSRMEKIGHPLFQPNLRAATWLADVCLDLIGRFDTFTKEQRMLATGAIRYFLLSADNLPDYTPRTGLDDDCLVMDHVLERLGLLDELSIQARGG